MATQPTKVPMRLGNFIRAACIAMPALFAAMPAEAEDRVHAGADPNSERWYFTLAYCAGRIKVVEEVARNDKRPDADALERGMNMLFMLSVDRLMEDRGIPQDKAIPEALQAVQEGVSAQKEANLIYYAAGNMNEEIDRRIAACDASLKAYAAEFPQKFGAPKAQ